MGCKCAEQFQPTTLLFIFLTNQTAAFKTITQASVTMVRTQHVANEIKVLWIRQST